MPDLYLFVKGLDFSAMHKYTPRVVRNEVSLVYLHLALLQQQLHLQVQVEEGLVFTQPVCVAPEREREEGDPQ